MQLFLLFLSFGTLAMVHGRFFPEYYTRNYNNRNFEPAMYEFDYDYQWQLAHHDIDFQTEDALPDESKESKEEKNVHEALPESKESKEEHIFQDASPESKESSEKQHLQYSIDLKTEEKHESGDDDDSKSNEDKNGNSEDNYDDYDYEHLQDASPESRESKEEHIFQDASLESKESSEKQHLQHSIDLKIQEKHESGDDDDDSKSNEDKNGNSEDNNYDDDYAGQSNESDSDETITEAPAVILMPTLPTTLKFPDPSDMKFFYEFIGTGPSESHSSSHHAQADDEDSGEKIIKMTHALNYSPRNSEILNQAHSEYLDKFNLAINQYHKYTEDLKNDAYHIEYLVKSTTQTNGDDYNSSQHKDLVKALSDSLVRLDGIRSILMELQSIEQRHSYHQLLKAVLKEI